MLVAIVVAATFLFFERTSGHHTAATELAPAETIFFLHFPDLKRTAERWPKTGLAQIGAEPEVQAFLAKPRANAPQMKLWTQKLEQVARVEPGEAFLAVTSIDGAMPRFIAGISFAGRKSDAQALSSQFDNVTLTFARRSGEHDQLFGSVTSGDIGSELEKKGFNVDRRKIQLHEPLKSLGEFTIPVKLHKDVTAHVRVIIEKEAVEE